MIYRIKTRRSRNNFEDLPLFQDIYQVNDGSKFYINGNVGPKCPGHIFTFHKDVEEEAVEMAEGLQVYLEYLYNTEVIYEYFSNDAWEEVEGWIWEEEKGSFVKPHDQKLENIINSHPMAKLFDMELVLNDEKKKNKKVVEREQEHDRATKELLRKINGQDTEVDTKDNTIDEGSVDTEHTRNTSVTKNKYKNEESNKQNEKDIPKQADKTIEAEEEPRTKIEEKKYLENLWDYNKGKDENIRMIKSFVIHKLNKEFQSQESQEFKNLLETAMANIKEVAANKYIRFNDEGQEDNKITQSDDEEETVATETDKNIIDRNGRKNSIKQPEINNIKTENQTRYETIDMSDSEEETVATNKEYNRIQNYHIRNIRMRREPTRNEEDSRSDNSTIQTVDSNSYQLRDSKKDEDGKIEKKEDQDIHGSAEETSDSDIEVTKIVSKKSTKAEKVYNVEEDMTHDEFLYKTFEFCRRNKDFNNWKLEDKLCYRASVMNSPTAHKIINEEDKKPDEVERDYDELAEEYFNMYPEKLKDVDMVASRQKTGKTP